MKNRFIDIFLSTFHLYFSIVCDSEVDSVKAVLKKEWDVHKRIHENYDSLDSFRFRDNCKKCLYATGFASLRSNAVSAPSEIKLHVSNGVSN